MNNDLVFAIVIVGVALASSVSGALTVVFMERRERRQHIDAEAQRIARTKVQREMHDANRTHLPRHDTSGPAKVHKSLSAKKPKQRKKS